MDPAFTFKLQHRPSSLSVPISGKLILDLDIVSDNEDLPEIDRKLMPGAEKLQLERQLSHIVEHQYEIQDHAHEIAEHEAGGSGKEHQKLAEQHKQMEKEHQVLAKKMIKALEHHKELMKQIKELGEKHKHEHK